MTLQVNTQPRQTQATLKVRQSITQLNQTEVTRLRNVLQEAINRHDNLGYQFFAGWHGVPLGICQHHNELFLPWHRGYLYHFELALQDIDPEVTIPWWNWMDEPGIPPAFEHKRVRGKANVLASAPIRPMGVPRRPNWPRKTHRETWSGGPGTPGPLAPPLGPAHFPGTSGGARDWMMSSPSYSEFMQRCWRVHDNVHVWVGGEMSDQNWAAFDPLFWAHHAMVDRLWRIWQHNNPGTRPANWILEQPMTFSRTPSMKVREVLDVKALGYEYAGRSASSPGSS